MEAHLPAEFEDSGKDGAGGREIVPRGRTGSSRGRGSPLRPAQAVHLSRTGRGSSTASARLGMHPARPVAPSPRSAGEGEHSARTKLRFALSGRERSEPSSLPQIVLGEGPARSARERASRGGGLARMTLREGCAPEGPGHRRAASMVRNRHRGLRGGGPARLATVVSLPTARAARPGAQRRDTPNSAGKLARTPGDPEAGRQFVSCCG
jgi:hypothetical protein